MEGITFLKRQYLQPCKNKFILVTILIKNAQDIFYTKNHLQICVVTNEFST